MKLIDYLSEKLNSNNTISVLLIIIVLGVIILIATSSFIEDTTKVDRSYENYYKNEMVIPSSNNIIEDYANLIEKKLEDILSKIKGVGEVKVMVTLEESAERIPAINTTKTEEKTSEKDSEGGTREVFKQNYSEQVVINSNNSNDLVIIKEVKPKVKGVIVVAEGAEDIYVKEKLYKAVKTVLGINGNRVEIFPSNIKGGERDGN